MRSSSARPATTLLAGLALGIVAFQVVSRPASAQHLVIVPPPEAVLPTGRAIAALSSAECTDVLTEGEVRFVSLESGAVAGVEMPIRLAGPVGGVTVSSRGHSEMHEIMDCRLAVAILAWAPVLIEAGARELVHYSTYRPGARVGGSGRRSAHASALALDLAIIEFDDDVELDVEETWQPRVRGGAPCEGELSAPEQRIRGLVCRAIAADLFQVVLTPHHDAAHADHVHLEVRPGVDWSYVR